MFFGFLEYFSGLVCVVAIIWIAVVMISSLIYWIIRRLKKPKLKDILVKVEKSEDIGSAYFDKLTKASIKSTDELLKKGATPEGRKEIENATGIGNDLIFKWINIADMLRIRDMNIEYIYLLKEAGVNSVVEFAQRNPEVFYKILVEINNRTKLVSKPPSVDVVRDWIEQAKKLPQIIEY